MKSHQKLPKNKEAFTRLGSIINTSLKKYRPEGDEELSQIWQIWNGTVGKVVAENVQPAAFKGKLLVAHVSSSAWLHQLQFLKKDIIEKINNAFGKQLVEDIKFKVGELGEE